MDFNPSFHFPEEEPETREDSGLCPLGIFREPPVMLVWNMVKLTCLKSLLIPPPKPTPHSLAFPVTVHGTVIRNRESSWIPHFHCESICQSRQSSWQNTSCICPLLSTATISTSCRSLSFCAWATTAASFHSCLVPTHSPKSCKTDHLKMQLRTKEDLRDWHLKGLGQQRWRRLWGIEGTRRLAAHRVTAKGARAAVLPRRLAVPERVDSKYHPSPGGADARHHWASRPSTFQTPLCHSLVIGTQMQPWSPEPAVKGVGEWRYGSFQLCPLLSPRSRHGGGGLGLTVLHTGAVPGSPNTCELMFGFTEALVGLMHTFEVTVFVSPSLPFLLYPPLPSWQIEKRSYSRRREIFRISL